mmetsp:Transcript_23131/g.34243  ORF Transcript_23131/g.34243 Transcript_23131/m.34243 type:complete len:270 (+) Transcript_23131:104-913(+)
MRFPNPMPCLPRIIHHHQYVTISIAISKQPRPPPPPRSTYTYCKCLKIIIIILRQGLRSSLSKLCLIPLLTSLINSKLWRLKSRRLNKRKLVIPTQLPRKPKKRLLKVIITLCRNIIILKILLAMKSDLLGLNLAILNLHLVSSKNNRNVLTYTGKITMPVRNILVSDTGGNVKHNDGALSLDVVSITESSEFFLPCSIPYVEFDGTAVCVEYEGVYFYSECCDVFLFEFSSEMTLDKGCFSYSTVSDEDELEFGHFLSSHDEYILYID